MSDDYKSLLGDINTELIEDENIMKTADEKKCAKIVKELLLIERDSRVPGAERSNDSRIKMLLDHISQEDI